jgi:hypothetical protein
VTSRPRDHYSSFRSHQNYLHAFSKLAGFTDSPGDDRDTLTQLAASVLNTFPRNTGKVNHDNDALVAACLNRAWGTELILATGMRVDNTDEFLWVANSWGCIQTYYIAYSATQALVVAGGHPRPDNHPKTQEHAIALWSRRRGGVRPFSFAADRGSVLINDARAYLHGPGRDIDLKVRPWSVCDDSNCWDLAALALRTTRKNAVDKAFDKARARKIKDRRKHWDNSERARLEAGKVARIAPSFVTAQLPMEEKLACEHGVRPYGLLDYLYRLRIKANYEETEVFTEGPKDGNSAVTVATSMVRIAAATMIAHETRIAQILGRHKVLDLAARWARKNKPSDATGIGLRMQVLEQVL